MDVRQNLNHILKKIDDVCSKINRHPEEITLIGVTKYVTIERTEALIDAGIKNIGENRTEELLKKYKKIGAAANWHFIGTLQSRKVKDVVDKVHTIHSLERLSVAKQINRRSDRVIDCFVQVNVSGEEAKYGLAPEAVLPFIQSLEPFDKVRVIGLMTMAPHTDDKETVRNVFRALAKLRDTIAKENLAHAPCTQLSMGMSNDYEIAIEEGATHIRLGSKLVGSSE